MRTKTVIILLSLFIYAGISAKRKPVPVIIIAGQSNTDGRVNNEELPEYIKQHGYRHCWWSYGSDTISGGGRFERFWPRVAKPDNINRWGYDAVVYYLIGQRIYKRLTEVTGGIR